MIEVFTDLSAPFVDVDADAVCDEMDSKSAAELLADVDPACVRIVRPVAQRLIVNGLGPHDVRTDGCDVVVAYGDDVEDRSPSAPTEQQAAGVALLLRIVIVDELERAAARARAFIADVNEGRRSLDEQTLMDAAFVLERAYEVQ